MIDIYAYKHIYNIFVLISMHRVYLGLFINFDN